MWTLISEDNEEEGEEGEEGDEGEGGTYLFICTHIVVWLFIFLCTSYAQKTNFPPTRPFSILLIN